MASDTIDMAKCPFCQNYFPENNGIVCSNCELRAELDIELGKMLISVNNIKKIQAKQADVLHNRSTAIYKLEAMLNEISENIFTSHE